MKRKTASPLATHAIDEIWRRAAARVGFEIARTNDAYATSDGRGGIAIGATETLDDDDAFAQLVFHELCHAITQGEGALQQAGLGPRQRSRARALREHACLRLQAWLSDRFGLRAAMAPTTPYRDYYAALPDDPLLPLLPLQGGHDDGDAVARAAAARVRFEASAWRAPIEEALAATAASIGSRLWRRPPPRRPTRSDSGSARRARPAGAAPGLYEGGRGVAVTRCRQSAPANGDGARTSRSHPACAHWEAPVDCRACGACCREAYHSVTVSMRDPVVWQEPDLIVRHGARFEIRREGPRCAALRIVEMGTRRVPSPRDGLREAKPRRARRDRRQQLQLHDLREPPAALPGIRGRRPSLPGRAPARRPQRPNAASRMAETVDLFVPLGELDEPLAPRLERALGWTRGQAGPLRVLRRSLDARKGRPLGQRMRVLVARAGESLAIRRAAPEPPQRWPAGRPAPRVVVVGSGPAGSWAALRLAEAGVPVTIVEQGKPVQPRRRDLALLTRGAARPPSSNYCFGEGGAGTYSDGKLYTRAKDRGGVAEVIADLVRFGAPADIAVEARPHVGSNRLPRVLHGAARAPRRAGRRLSLRDDGRRPARASAGACAPFAWRAATSCPPTSSCWRSATRRAPCTGGPRRTGSPSSASRSRSASASSTRSG